MTIERATIAVSAGIIRVLHRRFNRFFTRRIRVLREGLLHTPYSLTEARILFEISHRNDLTASELSHELVLDPGYLSRILARLE